MGTSAITSKCFVGSAFLLRRQVLGQFYDQLSPDWDNYWKCSCVLAKASLVALSEGFYSPTRESCMISGMSKARNSLRDIPEGGAAFQTLRNMESLAKAAPFDDIVQELIDELKFGCKELETALSHVEAAPLKQAEQLRGFIEIVVQKLKNDDEKDFDWLQNFFVHDLQPLRLSVDTWWEKTKPTCRNNETLLLLASAFYLPVTICYYRMEHHLCNQTHERLGPISGELTEVCGRAHQTYHTLVTMTGMRAKLKPALHALARIAHADTDADRFYFMVIAYRQMRAIIPTDNEKAFRLLDRDGALIAAIGDRPEPLPKVAAEKDEEAATPALSFDQRNRLDSAYESAADDLVVQLHELQEATPTVDTLYTQVETCAKLIDQMMRLYLSHHQILDSEGRSVHLTAPCSLARLRVALLETDLDLDPFKGTIFRLSYARAIVEKGMVVDATSPLGAIWLQNYLDNLAADPAQWKDDVANYIVDRTLSCAAAIHAQLGEQQKPRHLTNWKVPRTRPNATPIGPAGPIAIEDLADAQKSIPALCDQANLLTRLPNSAGVPGSTLRYRNSKLQLATVALRRVRARLFNKPPHTALPVARQATLALLQAYASQVDYPWDADRTVGQNLQAMASYPGMYELKLLPQGWYDSDDVRLLVDACAAILTSAFPIPQGVI